MEPEVGSAPALPSMEGFGLFITPGERHGVGGKAEAGVAVIHQLSCVTMLKQDGAGTGRTRSGSSPFSWGKSW